MTQKRKQFSPHIYAEWGELFDNISSEERSEILLGITKFPEYEPKNTTIWNFIKSQIEKDYELFIERCQKNGNISRSYWGKNKSNDNRTISNDIQSNSNDIERYPKHKHKHKQITNNELQITNNISAKNGVVDIFINEYRTHFEKEYKRIFKQKPFLSKEELSRIVDLARIYSPEIITQAIEKLKNLKFENIPFTPTANWLLKENNFERLMNGEFDKAQEEEVDLQERQSQIIQELREKAIKEGRI